MSDNPQTRPPTTNAVRLPRFEQLASRFDDAFQFHVLQAVRSQGVIGHIRSTTIHEGRRSTIVRESGVIDETELRAFGTEIELTREQIESISIRDIERCITTMADQLRRQQSEHLFQTMNAVTEATGQVIDGRGQPFDHDHMLQALRMMPPSFDPLTGESNISVVVGSGMMERIRDLEQDYQRREELQQAVRQIEAEKRDEHRTQEMDRVLVG